MRTLQLTSLTKKRFLHLLQITCIQLLTTHQVQYGKESDLNAIYEIGDDEPPGLSGGTFSAGLEGGAAGAAAGRAGAGASASAGPSFWKQTADANTPEHMRTPDDDDDDDDDIVRDIRERERERQKRKI